MLEPEKTTTVIETKTTTSESAPTAVEVKVEDEESKKLGDDEDTQTTQIKAEVDEANGEEAKTSQQ